MNPHPIRSDPLVSVVCLVDRTRLCCFSCFGCSSRMQIPPRVAVEGQNRGEEEGQWTVCSHDYGELHWNSSGGSAPRSWGPVRKFVSIIGSGIGMLHPCTIRTADWRTIPNNEDDLKQHLFSGGWFKNLTQHTKKIELECERMTHN